MSPVDFTSLSLWARDTASDISSVPDTFSSWDKCMEKSYCKWPVVAAIIVGGVIVLSVVACVANCLCCGIRCCTGCCGCFCPSPRTKRNKYQDDPYSRQPPPMVPPNHGYQNPQFQAPQAPPMYRGPQQVARFDAPPSPGVSKGNEDALPAMPSWDKAVTRRIEDPNPHSDVVEMEPLNLMDPGPHRTPSASRLNGVGGYMGPPPIRTGTSNGVRANPQPYEHPQNPYDYRSHEAGRNPGLPYDQPYRDYSPGNTMYSMSPPPNAHAPHQQQYGAAISPSTEMNRPIPYRQPSPGISYTQTQPPSYRGMFPGVPSSPPPPFSTHSNYEPYEPHDQGRPPSILQSGRRPVPNSYRDV
ncbi:hypothetical protein ARAM_007172 [Aspergillus rambellii]|uniref:Fibroin-3 related protein n=1 Tax=Aspergillus rambellii TaxID=308745 RepID=A0A0F8VGB3_9EURO|nr:hypothetical protein ARAM_007172 [Aspergillus rambellii]